MSSVKCLKKSSIRICEKFSSRKLLKFLKAVKPVVKLMRAHRNHVVTPSVCNYDVVESFQNDLNDLHFSFFDGDEADENLKNELIEKQLLLKLGSAPSDIDICKGGDDYSTSRQRAEQQVAVAAN